MATISKTGILNGSTIEASHITGIIDALDGTGTSTIIATGSLHGSASYALTASYALNGGGGGGGAVITSGSTWNITSSWATNAITARTASYIASSNVDGPLGKNSILSASFAVSGAIMNRGTTLYSAIPSFGDFFSSTSIPEDAIFLGRLAGDGANSSNDTSIFIGLSAGEQALNSQQSVFIGEGAGAIAVNVDKTVAIGNFAARGLSTGTANAIAIGTSASLNAGALDDCISIGFLATAEASSSTAVVHIGKNAGAYGGISNSNTVFIGTNAGRSAYGISDAINIGRNSGDGCDLSNGSINLGVAAASMSIGNQYAISIGLNAGVRASGSDYFIAIGSNAGRTLDSSFTPPKQQNSVLIGRDTARDATGALIGTVAVGYDTISESSGNMSQSVFVGEKAGLYAKDMLYSVVLGRYAAVSASNSSLSVIIGRNAAEYSTNCSESIFIGGQAGSLSKDISDTVAIGHHALSGVTGSEYVVAVGDYAGYNMGPGNTAATFLGRVSGYEASQSFGATAVGYASLYQSTGSALGVYIGWAAGYSSSYTEGAIAIGRSTANSSTRISGSVFIGEYSGYLASSSVDSTYVGAYSGTSASFTDFTTAIGWGSAGGTCMYSTGSSYLGHRAGYNSSYMNNAVAIGYFAGANCNNTAGNKSRYMVALGTGAGANTTPGDGVVMIGPGVGCPADYNQYTSIGNVLFVSGTYLPTTPELSAINSVRTYADHKSCVGIGLRPAETGRGALQVRFSTSGIAHVADADGAWTTTSDARLKENIQAVDYNLSYDVIDNLTLKNYTWIDAASAGTQIGWIAQEVKEVLPDAVSISDNTINEGLSDEHSLSKDVIYAHMFGTIKKLMAENNTLKQEIASIKTHLGL